MTRNFVEQMLRVEDAVAVELCEQNAEAKESEGDPVNVSNVRITGSMATAEVGQKDRSAEGQGITVALIEQDGAWKLVSRVINS
jgi:hypothetical protein